MKISVAKERKERENRVALTPDVVASLIKSGFEILIENGAGANSSIPDEEYQKAGATMVSDKNKIYSDADVCKHW